MPIIYERKLAIFAAVIVASTAIAIANENLFDEVNATGNMNLGTTLYVGGTGPGNYTHIQDAIDNASDGDTVYVFNGTYYENVVVDKSINLIGENRNTTIIDGGGIGDVIYITADQVNISEFTMQNSGSSSGDAGIDIRSNSNNISGNNISLNNEDGIYLFHSSGNNIHDNDIGSSKGNGIEFYYSSGNNIHDNGISNNDYGICLSSSSNNLLYHNNFVNNTQNAYDDGSNTWDNGYLSSGNYWDDYDGIDNYQGPNQDINGSDGIGDTPYNISGDSNQDRYPLMYPVGTPDETPPTSYVDSISPYWHNVIIIPFQINAIASDNISRIVYTELWYRYSTDNSSWNNWTLFGTDDVTP